MKKIITMILTFAIVISSIAVPVDRVNAEVSADTTQYDDKNEQDVKELKKLIDEQYGRGGAVAENLDSWEYTWTNGRLTGIKWNDRYLTGNLNVSGLTALTELNCRNNQITNLDVSGNKNLTKLECRFNQLTSLDISGNKNLTELECGFNQLTSLDVNGNKDLTTLNCDRNQLTSLDVSENKDLTTLNCDCNQLTSLDVSENKNLTMLNCESNQLTGLDVSKNVKLTRLRCRNNKLKYLDITNNKKLKKGGVRADENVGIYDGSAYYLHVQNSNGKYSIESNVGNHSFHMTKGQKCQMYISDEDCCDEDDKFKDNGSAKWTSSKPSVVSVNNKGIIKAKKQGSAKITVKCYRIRLSTTVKVAKKNIYTRKLKIEDKDKEGTQSRGVSSMYFNKKGDLIFVLTEKLKLTAYGRRRWKKYRTYRVGTNPASAVCVLGHYSRYNKKLGKWVDVQEDLHVIVSTKEGDIVVNKRMGKMSYKRTYDKRLITNKKFKIKKKYLKIKKNDIYLQECSLYIGEEHKYGGYPDGHLPL